MKNFRTICLIVLIIIALPVFGWAQTGLPTINLGIEESTDPTDFGLSIKILFMLTILSLAPSILIMTASVVNSPSTSFAH